MKYLILFIVAAIILFPKQSQNKSINLVQQEWDQFCKIYMQWVNRYPLALHPGDCV